MRAVASRVLAGALSAVALVGQLGPISPAWAQAPEIERAKDLYKAAETAIVEGRYDDAIRDYGAAYEITKDPAFFYKLGSANERAGKCDVALIYFRRYLKEGKPSEEFAKLTEEKIRGCGGDPGTPEPAQPAPGDAKPAPGDARPAPSDAKPAPGDAKPAPGDAKPAQGDAAQEPEPAQVGLPTQPAAPPPPPPPRLGRYKGPWLLVGGAIAFVTVGGVLAYSSDTAERDVEDLYVGLNGTPPPFNATTQRRYQDAIDEGKRYQTLSIASFIAAGAFAVGAAIWFVASKDEKLVVAPAVAPGTAGVSTTIRF